MSSLKLRTFTDADWMGFSGCSSKYPILVETPDPDFFVIVDGDHAEAHRLVGEEKAYYYSAKFPTAGLTLIAVMSLTGDESLEQVEKAWDEFAIPGSGHSDEL